MRISMKIKSLIVLATMSLAISTSYAEPPTHSLAYTMEDAYNALPKTGSAGTIAKVLTDKECNPGKFSITSRFYLNGKNLSSDASDHIGVSWEDGSLYHGINHAPEQADRIQITVNATCSDNTPISFTKIINIEPR